MSTTDSDRSIEEQLQALLDHNAPAVTLGEVRETSGVRRAGTFRAPARRPAGPRPALVWTFAFLLLALVGFVVVVEVNTTSNNRSPHTGRPPTSSTSAARPKTAVLSDYIHLDRTTVTAGVTMSGDLVVSNNGGRINLTHGCEPSFAAYLSNGKISQTVAVPTDCLSEPFYIDHGTTRLAFTLLTTYTSCNASGTATGPDNPACQSSGPPPLPAGKYIARIEWSGKVSLPSPKPVAVTITAAESGTTTTVPQTTKQETFEPWLNPTSLQPRIRVISSLSGGNCWTESVPDYDNQYAWRCMSGNEILDPCFAPPGASNVTQVACALSPTGGVYLLTLSTPLAQSSSPRTSGGHYAWYVVLSNGQGCSSFDGAGPPTDSGITLDYTCTTGSAAEPDRNADPWTDQYAATDNAPLQSVPVSQAWN